MLRVKSCARRKEISLYLPDQEPWFSLHLRKALAIALLLHIIGYTVFKIHYAAADTEIILPPIAVNADLSMITTTATMAMPIIGDYGILEHTLAPVHLEASPSRASMPIFTLPLSSQTQKSSIFDKNSSLTFQQIENNLVLPHQLEMLAPVAYHPVTIHVLSSRQMPALTKSWQKLLGHTLPQKKEIERNLLLYAVQIENRSGRVFYCEEKNPIQNKGLQQLGQQIIQKLRFESSLQLGITACEIEIVLSYESDINKGIFVTQQILKRYLKGL